MRDLFLLPLRNMKHHRDSSFDGDQRKHGLTASPSIPLFLDTWVQSLTPSFRSTRIPKDNFLHSKEIPLRYSVFKITLSNLNGFTFFYCEHAHNIIPDISVSLEYFISVEEQSYFVSSPVGGQLHQFPCLASNTYTINRFSALHNHRIILDISVFVEYSLLTREQVPFHMEDICTTKSEFGVFWAILHHFI